MTAWIFIVSGIEHGRLQALYVNGCIIITRSWWNKTFHLQLDDCEWIQCIDPPLPEGMNLKSDFDGSSPYEFGDNATYTCASQGLYFEEDKDMESFSVDCLVGGRWKVPISWPKCVASEYQMKICNIIGTFFF